jgi:hypothetical protein
MTGFAADIGRHLEDTYGVKVTRKTAERVVERIRKAFATKDLSSRRT